MESGTTSARLVERGDLDELTRHVDRLSEAGDWDGLVDLRDRCRRALERGKQLWPVAANAEYRLALDAPAAWAAAVLDSATARFTLGPLPEVAASTHRWAELAPFVGGGAGAAFAAHERAVRGEDLRDDAVAGALPPVLDVPFWCEAWEPVYAAAEYHDDRAEFPTPQLSIAIELHPPTDVDDRGRVDDPDVCRALTDLGRAWAAESNGRTEAVAVRGSAGGAVAALGIARTRLRMAEIAPPDGLALMAWTAASGGAHGRRRGAAAGRDSAWWALAALAGLLEDWPVTPDELGEAAAELRWFVWDGGEPDTGWALRLAVQDPAEGLAWAVAATDAA